MNIALWIAQAVLALMFLMAGTMKMTKPKNFLKEKIGGWVDSFSDNGIKIIGFVEFLAAVGLILPMSLNILPILVVIAGGGLAATMIGAMIVHAKRQEKKEIGMNLVLFLVIGFVVVGRTILEPVF